MINWLLYNVGHMHNVVMWYGILYLMPNWWILINTGAIYLIIIAISVAIVC